MVRARATRFRIPPDSSAGYFSSAWRRPMSPSRTSARRGAAGACPARIAPIATFSRAVFQGSRASDWKRTPCPAAPGYRPPVQPHRPSVAARSPHTSEGARSCRPARAQDRHELPGRHPKGHPVQGEVGALLRVGAGKRTTCRPPRSRGAGRHPPRCARGLRAVAAAAGEAPAGLPARQLDHQGLEAGELGRVTRPDPTSMSTAGSYSSRVMSPSPFQYTLAASSGRRLSSGIGNSGMTASPSSGRSRGRP